MMGVREGSNRVRGKKRTKMKEEKVGVCGDGER